MQSLRAAIVLLVLGAAAATRSPVERVVNLLKKLQGGIEQDGENEAQVYNKYACWCDQALKGKADAIDNARGVMRSTSQEILTQKGRVATYTAEINELEDKIRDAEEEIETETSLRQKQNGEYQDETAEKKKAILALQEAVTVLREATTPAKKEEFLQVHAGPAAVKAVLEVMPSRSTSVGGKLAVLTQYASSARQASSSGYAPQSATVQGILVDMYATFASDLESAESAEAKMQRDFEKTVAQLETQLALDRKVKAETEARKAEAEQQLAEATALYDETEKEKEADIEFFDEARATCEDTHKQYVDRKTSREAELDGIKEAIKILSSDDARELFASAIKPGKEVGTDDKYDSGVDIAPASFLQTSSSGAAVERAFAMLQKQAAQEHSLRLAQLAVQVRQAKVGHFDAVIKAIDEMIQTLKDEETDDIKKRDQCKEEYKNTDSKIANEKWEIKVNNGKIDKLEDRIANRQKEREETIEAIATVTKQMEDMTKQREAENKEFLAKKEEDTSAIGLLKEARKALAKYYKENKINMGPIQGGVKDLALAQEDPEFKVDRYDAPEIVFSGKNSRKNEKKDIVSLMTMLIEDLNDEIKNGMKEEEETQLRYEKAMKAATHYKKMLEEKKVSLESMIADLKEDKSDEEDRRTYNKAELKDETDYRAKITPDCDWVFKAFKERDSRREAEMAGLNGAKDYLVGAKEPALLQGPGGRTFDDNALSNVRFLGLSA